MNGSPLDWLRWITEAKTQTDGVSKEIIDSLTQWLGQEESETSGPNFDQWRDTIPNSILTLTELIQRLRQWVGDKVDVKTDDEVIMLTRRIELLERELERLKGRIPSDERRGSDSDDPAS